MNASHKIVRGADSGYFAALTANRPIAALIATQLEPLTPAGAKALRTCGRFPIGSGPIELIEGGHGLFARGVKWCSSRLCPTCRPRLMAVLGSKRAARARAADAAGFGIAFLQAGQPVGGAGELDGLVVAQLADWRAAFPSPSRLPVAWKQAGLSDWIGTDWNTELDWDLDGGHWHVHAHALAFRRSLWTPPGLTFLEARWPHPAPLFWTAEAECPEAAARYSVKAENEKPHILGLFDLAGLGMTTQVSEYLHAVQGQRLRASSRKLTDLLNLGGSGEEDAVLMAQAEALPGEVVGQFTPREWCARW